MLPWEVTCGEYQQRPTSLESQLVYLRQLLRDKSTEQVQTARDCQSSERNCARTPDVLTPDLLRDPAISQQIINRLLEFSVPFLP